MQKCPICGLVNPDALSRCDCGYIFPDEVPSASVVTPKQDAIAEQKSPIKKILSVLIGATILLFIYGLQGWSDYTWNSRYITAAGSDWAVYDRQTNAINPIYVWQFVKQPAHRIGMIQLSSIKQVGQGVYKYLHRWVNRNWDGKVSAEDFIGFIDCGRGLNGYLRKGADEGNYRLADIEWAKSDDSPYAKSEKDKQRLNEVFQSKCRIVTSYGHGE